MTFVEWANGQIAAMTQEASRFQCFGILRFIDELVEDDRGAGDSASQRFSFQIAADACMFQIGMFIEPCP